MDILGPFSTSSMIEHKYFLSVINDYSRYSWIILMKFKSKTSKIINYFIYFTQPLFKVIIKTIRSDNDLEFLWKDLYLTHGIHHQTSYVDTPQQNGLVERNHQHLLEVTRAIIFQYKLPDFFWSRALSYVFYIINHLPSRLLQYKCLFTLTYHVTPDYSLMITFGCLVFSCSTKHSRTKLVSRYHKCIYLGIKNDVKCHILYDLYNRNLFISRVTIFFEHLLHFRNKQSPCQITP